MDRLPVDNVLADIDRSLASHSRLVLQAPPGTGKSTRVPLHLLDADWLRGPILMLEPRRIAARNLAAFLAAQRGEEIGGSVGLQVRDHRQIGPDTRLQIITEGILTRRIQSDPELGGADLVIFDEFHERHLQTDLALALALDVQANLRPQLRILVMSATIDAKALGRWLDAPVIHCEGRSYPVDIEHRRTRERFPESREIGAAVSDLIDHTAGDVLVFLPGRSEIERAAAAIPARADIAVRKLYGALPLSEQRAALSPSQRRRVVLATNIAESSLTVPGVTAVVDSGLERAPVFDPTSGLTRLVTRRISMASAAQRAGRAGRLQAGSCLRLWSPAERLEAAAAPEITSADLSSLVLELKAWGCEPADLKWLDPPPAGAWAQAEDLLWRLGALDEQRRPTPLAARLLRWGTEPRLAAVLEAAGKQLPLACQLVALLEGSTPQAGGDRQDDLREIWRAWHSGQLPRSTAQHLQRQAQRWQQRSGCAARGQAPDEEAIGMLLLSGWPDRLARRREDGQRRYQMVNGRGVQLRARSELFVHDWLVVCDAVLDSGDSPIRLAAPVAAADVMARLGGQIEEQPVLRWDAQTQGVRAERVRRLGAVVLDTRSWSDPPPEAIAAALLQGIRTAGLDALPWSEAAQHLRQRVAFLRAHLGDDWPDWSAAALDETLDDWLGPYLAGAASLADLRRLDLHRVLVDRLGYPGAAELDRLAPERIAIPSGREARIDYADPQSPVLAVKLQEMFGQSDTPRIAMGQVPLTLHLLSPAGRPLQITRDLGHFWANAYAQVRKEMRGRYPKHPWPDDPVTAIATARTKRASGQQ